MMRKISFGVGVFLMCLLLVLSPSVALGEDRELEGGVGVGWAGEVEGGNYAVHARALNKYNAACWAMGVNPLTISTFNRSKLSDPNYGGDFYVYAQSFTNIIGWDDVPGWMPTYATLTFVMYGFDNQWASEVSKSLYDSAKVDFKRVLAGEDVGGGGGGDTPSTAPSMDYYTSVPVISYRTQAAASSSNNKTVPTASVVDGQLVVDGGTTVINPMPRSSHYVENGLVYLSRDFVLYINEFVSQGRSVGISLSLNGTFSFWVADGLSLSYNSSLRMYRYHGSNCTAYSFTFSNDPVLYADGHTLIFTVSPLDFAVRATESVSLPNGNYYMSEPITSPLSVPPAVTVGPSGTWPEPETPTTPEPPEVPTPTAPTDVPDPTPTDPTVVWPTAPIIVNPPEVTVEVTPSGLDYTQLLTEINDNLLSIDSYTKAINSSLNSLRSDLVSGFDDVVSAIRNVYQYLQHFDSILEVHCKHLRDALDDGIYNLELYLKRLFEWLPKQLDFDANFDYDDSAVTTLLRSILNKIPGSNGNPNTFKPNPQADEPGFFDWLLDLWHRFLIDLVSVLPDELGGLVDAFSQLTHYFPFSIPWDLFALLALFEHEPVTPVFDIPWGFGGDEGQVQNIRIDLSCWDGVMAMVRPVFLVGFCFQLALITKDLLSGFDINKGGV